MRVNSLKLLSRLKSSLLKISTDKMMHTDLQIFNKSSKSPHPFNIYEYLKLGEEKISAVQQTVQQMYKETFEGDDAKKIKQKIELWKQMHRAKRSEEIKKAVNALNSLKIAADDQQIMTDVESLTAILKQHPEARRKAVQQGALRILLKKGLSVTDELAKGSIREALVVLGYTNPVSARGIRILSIDGGGIRGVLACEMLKKLEKLSGKRTYELFDFICGVSTGAVLTYSIGVKFDNLDTIIENYGEISQEIFNQSPIWGAGNLVWSHGYYSTEKWEDTLKNYFGSDSLISTSRNPKCPKLCIVATLVNQDEVSPFLFRNYAFPWQVQSLYDGTFDAEVWQAARASAAAPTYFEEFRIRDLILQDGGITVNNPTAVAVHEARLLWPNTPIQCIVSLGTGRVIYNRTYDFGESSSVEDLPTSWARQFYKIIDSATDTQGVHIMLNDLLPADIYFRLNPHLTEMVGMVETDKKKQEQLRKDAITYLGSNEGKFRRTVKTLMLRKTMGQKIREKIQFRKDLLGL